MMPELIEATKLLGQTGLSPQQKAEETEQGRERLTPLSDMAPAFINLKESESLSCPSDRRGCFPI